MNKRLILVAISYLFTLIHSSSTNNRGNKNHQDIICDPSNLDNCYPRIFEPTSEWQLIKPGQDIPPGLHVRLNMETLEKEAKLMEREEEEENRKGEVEQQHKFGQEDNHNAGDVNNKVVELIVGENNGDDESPKNQNSNEAGETAKEQTKSRNEQIQQQILKAKTEYKPKSRVNAEDLTNFDSALNEVEQYDAHLQTQTENNNKERFELALDTIQDYVHDIELGVKLTSSKDSTVLRKLIDLAESGDGELKSKVYNIIASSLRNNPEAVQNIIDGRSGIDYTAFTKSLLGQLELASDLVQKRILGIVQALTQNVQFVESFFTFAQGHNYGLNTLVENFTKLGPQAKTRAANILQDLDLVGKSNDRRSLEDDDPSSNVSNFIQHALVENKVSTQSEFEKYFDNLVTIHQQDETLKPTREFLNWLAREVEVRKEKKKRDDVSLEELKFDEEMLRARHEVFGNPMGLRKAIADEL